MDFETLECGRVTHTRWLVNGVAHRDGAPACIRQNDGKIIRMEWRVMGKLHRIGAPAVIGYDDDGRVILEEWWNDGRLHRDGAPACIEYAAGIPIVMEWWRNDLRHNDHGAGIVSYECGRIMRQWWLNGVRVERFRVTSREWIGVVRQLLPQPIAEEIEYVLL